MLADFLARVKDTEDTSSLFDTLREEKTSVSKRRLRSLVRRDLDPVSINSLPDAMSLSRGKLEVRFDTVEQLAECMLMLAKVPESDGEEFDTRYAVLAEKSGELSSVLLGAHPLPSCGGRHLGSGA